MKELRVENKGPVTWITITRPEAMNAVTPAMHHRFQEIFDDFAKDDAQRIAVITGSGERAFCAGSDLKEGLSDHYPKNGYGGLTERYDLHKPVIAAVNGLALGGGFEIALACDIIVASDKAEFGLPEPLVGAVALGGGLHRLPRQIGLKKAMGLILSSRRINAVEADRLGLVNEVVPPKDLIAATERWCADILKGAPQSIATSKATAMAGLEEPNLEAALKNQADYPIFKRWRSSDDFKEGLKAFAEKRAPNWTGS